MAKRPGIQLDMPINGTRAFSFQANSCEPVGFIRTWKFQKGGELKPDLEVWDPENPKAKIKVVAVLHDDTRAAYWEGGPTDQMDYKGLLSYKNAAQLNTIINSTDAGTDQEVSILIINHDDDKDVFYRTLDTEKPLKVVFSPDERCEVKDKANQEIPEPRNYGFSVSFTAKGKAGVQEVNCAKSAGLKVVKEFGGVGAGG